MDNDINPIKVVLYEKERIHVNNWVANQSWVACYIVLMVSNAYKKTHTKIANVLEVELYELYVIA